MEIFLGETIEFDGQSDEYFRDREISAFSIKNVSKRILG